MDRHQGEETLKSPVTGDFCCSFGAGMMAGSFTSSRHTGPRSRRWLISRREGCGAEGRRAQTDPSFSRFIHDRTLTLGGEVGRIAEANGCMPSTLSITWLMEQPVVSSVIVGATRSEQLDENLKSVELELTAETLRSLNEISELFRYGKPFATYRIS
ncbi:aldo/keto reductase [Paenibacillus chibensis]|uniref:Aldo/keto reductase n=1 Tax=Paenibacillus chibensis TaxID=59846 RepID=A0ABU6PWK3_9BACL|nr:aldo/keto reductase [Paenibacillus chibensis]